MPEELNQSESDADSLDIPVEVEAEKDYIPEPGGEFDERIDCDQVVVDVVGEPISRCEAYRLEAELAVATATPPIPSAQQVEPVSAALHSLAEQPAPTEPDRSQGRHTERIVSEEKIDLPSSIVDPAVGKLKRAEDLLTSGELDNALILAQEAAKDSRTAKQARLIIARTFMEQGENAKALSVLQAMPRSDENAESLYYRGLAAARLNRNDEASKYLARALALRETDSARRNSCQSLHDRIRQAQRVRDEERDGAIDDMTGARPKPVERIKRRYRPRTLTRVLVALLVIIVAAGMLLLNITIFSPETFAGLRSYLASWSFLTGNSP